MADLAERYPANPLLTAFDVSPQHAGWDVLGVLNPGVFTFEGRTGLLVRVAERPPQAPGSITVAQSVGDGSESVRLQTFSLDDPDLDAGDNRVIHHGGSTFLTSMSHLALFWVGRGGSLLPDPAGDLFPAGPQETYGIEDARVVDINGVFHITYSAVSPYGVCGCHATTTDFRHYTRHGVILAPPNKDLALLPEPVRGRYYLIHRPMDQWFGGLNMWIASSHDLHHWGNHFMLMETRDARWDSQRIGGGASPIKTDHGWLAIYHGADHSGRYCLGAVLLDLNDPEKVVARSDEPIMEPRAPYELEGFFSECLFTNGHTVCQKEITLYYGASDTVVCAARLSVSDILESLGV